MLALRNLQGQLTETLSATCSGSGGISGDGDGSGDEETHLNGGHDGYLHTSTPSLSSSSSSSSSSGPRNMTGVKTENFFSAPNLKVIFGVTEERDAIKAAEAAAVQEGLGRTGSRPRVIYSNR